MSRTGKSIEMESRSIVVRDWRDRGWDETKRYRSFFGTTKKVWN